MNEVISPGMGLLGTKHKIVILQHPQEPRGEKGTVPLLVSLLENLQVKVGLSWKNAKSVIGENETPSRWGVFYLGSVKPPPGLALPALLSVDKKGQPIPGVLPDLDGLVFLDGTWSQAKTLWWRNAWLMKLKRLVLFPDRPSLYGKLRKEPRRECLSTAESVGLSLSFLREDPSIQNVIEKQMLIFMNTVKNAQTRP